MKSTDRKATAIKAIKKRVSPEEYIHLEQEISSIQSFSEQSGFALGFKYALHMLLECEKRI